MVDQDVPQRFLPRFYIDTYETSDQQLVQDNNCGNASVSSTTRNISSSHYTAIEKLKKYNTNNNNDKTEENSAVLYNIKSLCESTPQKSRTYSVESVDNNMVSLISDDEHTTGAVSNTVITASNPAITASNPVIGASNPVVSALNPVVTALNTDITSSIPDFTDTPKEVAGNVSSDKPEFVYEDISNDSIPPIISNETNKVVQIFDDDSFDGSDEYYINQLTVDNNKPIVTDNKPKSLLNNYSCFNVSISDFTVENHIEEKKTEKSYDFNLICEKARINCPKIHQPSEFDDCENVSVISETEREHKVSSTLKLPIKLDVESINSYICNSSAQNTIKDNNITNFTFRTKIEEKINFPNSTITECKTHMDIHSNNVCDNVKSSLNVSFTEFCPSLNNSLLEGNNALLNDSNPLNCSHESYISNESNISNNGCEQDLHKRISVNVDAAKPVTCDDSRILSHDEVQKQFEDELIAMAETSAAAPDETNIQNTSGNLQNHVNNVENLTTTNKSTPQNKELNVEDNTTDKSNGQPCDITDKLTQCKSPELDVYSKQNSTSLPRYMKKACVQEKWNHIQLLKKKLLAGIATLNIAKQCLISKCKCTQNLNYIEAIKFLTEQCVEGPKKVMNIYQKEKIAIKSNPLYNDKLRQDIIDDCEYEFTEQLENVLLDIDSKMEIHIKQVNNKCSCSIRSRNPTNGNNNISTNSNIGHGSNSLDRQHNQNNFIPSLHGDLPRNKHTVNMVQNQQRIWSCHSSLNQNADADELRCQPDVPNIAHSTPMISPDVPSPHSHLSHIVHSTPAPMISPNVPSPQLPSNIENSTSVPTISPTGHSHQSNVSSNMGHMSAVPISPTGQTQQSSISSNMGHITGASMIPPIVHSQKQNLLSETPEARIQQAQATIKQAEAEIMLAQSQMEIQTVPFQSLTDAQTTQFSVQPIHRHYPKYQNQMSLKQMQYVQMQSQISPQTQIRIPSSCSNSNISSEGGLYSRPVSSHEHSYTPLQGQIPIPNCRQSMTHHQEQMLISNTSNSTQSRYRTILPTSHLDNNNQNSSQSISIHHNYGQHQVQMPISNCPQSRYTTIQTTSHLDNSKQNFTQSMNYNYGQHQVQMPISNCTQTRYRTILPTPRLDNAKQISPVMNMTQFTNSVHTVQPMHHTPSQNMNNLQNMQNRSDIRLVNNNNMPSNINSNNFQNIACYNNLQNASHNINNWSNIQQKRKELYNAINQPPQKKLRH